MFRSPAGERKAEAGCMGSDICGFCTPVKLQAARAQQRTESYEGCLVRRSSSLYIKRILNLCRQAACGFLAPSRAPGGSEHAERATTDLRSILLQFHGRAAAPILAVADQFGPLFTSGRWRRVIEETEWASVELRLKPLSWRGDGDRPADEPGAEAAPAGRGVAAERVCSSLMIKSLRLGGAAGCRIAVRAELDDASTPDAPDLNPAAEAAASCACRLVEFIAGRGRPRPQLREVVVELIAGDRIVMNGAHLDPAFASALLLGALRALRPPEVGGAAGCGPSRSALETLSVGITGGRARRFDDETRELAWPAAAELRAALAPFPALASLTVSLNGLDAGAGPEEAAAVAAACPLLRSLALRPADAAALGALAPLAHLQQLTLMLDCEYSSSGLDATDGLAALAGGPAGRSLRRIDFIGARGYFMAGEFPRQVESPRPSLSGPSYLSLTTPPGAVSALARMPNLAAVGPLRFSTEFSDPATATALGRATSLREAFIHVNFCDYFAICGQRTPTFIRALTDSISRAPPPPGAACDDSGIRSNGARRALAHLDLHLDRPTTPAEREALRRLPNLRTLRLDSAPVNISTL
eukprot:tig00022075_g23647.t1